MQDPQQPPYLTDREIIFHRVLVAAGFTPQQAEKVIQIQRAIHEELHLWPDPATPSPRPEPESPP